MRALFQFLLAFMLAWCTTAHGDPRLFGYWYLTDADEKTDFSDVDYVELLHQDGRQVAIPTDLKNAGSSPVVMNVEIEGDVAHFTSEEVKHDSSWNYEFLRDDFVRFTNSTGIFYYKRMPEQKTLHKAILRLALTGEVASYDFVGAEDFFENAKTIHVTLKGASNQLLLAHVKNGGFHGTLSRNGKTLAQALEPNVVVFAYKQGGDQKQLDSVFDDLANPVVSRGSE